MVSLMRLSFSFIKDGVALPSWSGLKIGKSLNLIHIEEPSSRWRNTCIKKYVSLIYFFKPCPLPWIIRFRAYARGHWRTPKIWHLSRKHIFFFLILFKCLPNWDGWASIRGNYGLPMWLSSKESAYNAGDAASIPGSAKSPKGRNSSPLQYSCLGNPMDRGAWQATVHVVAELDTTWWVSMHAWGWRALRNAQIQTPHFLGCQCWLSSLTSFSQIVWGALVKPENRWSCFWPESFPATSQW